MEKIDLLFPNVNKKPTSKKIPCDFVNDLDLEYIASIINFRNTDYTLKILSELQTDINVIKYRQDVLADFINLPALGDVFLINIAKIYKHSKKLNNSNGVTQSFFELSDNIQALEAYFVCVQNIHNFHIENKNKYKSEAIILLMNELEKNYNSASNKKIKTEIAKLKEGLENGLKSVTVAINFDNLMRPIEAAIISIEKTHFREKKVFDWLMYNNEPRNVPFPNSKVYKTIDETVSDESDSQINRTLFKEINNLTENTVKHINIAMQTFYNNNITFLLELEQQINFYIGAKNLIERFNNHGIPMCNPKILNKEERFFSVDGMIDVVFANKAIRSEKSDEKANLIVNKCVMGENGRIFILTGPNSGGKTTYLRAIGISQVLAQAGLYVPGTAADISIVDSIFTLFPKEELIGLNTSRFTIECIDLDKIVRNSSRYSLVLMNESISSTTLTECLIVSKEILKTFRYISLRCVFATHLLELSNEIDEINEVSGDSKLVSMVSGISKNGVRTFIVEQGVALKESYASQISEKYGISYENYKKVVKI